MLTYIVAGLLVFVTLLISGSLLLVRATIGVAQSLPPLSEHLANLACMRLDTKLSIQGPGNATYRKRCRGSPREPSHGCRWRRTCRQRDHAWGRWGLYHALTYVSEIEGNIHTLLSALSATGLGGLAGGLLLRHFDY